MPSQPKIAIVGGGPAGLTLGLLLHRHRVPFTIFELRHKPNEEELAKPSGMLDLHGDSGLLALKECGVYDDFIPLTGDCSEDFVVAERNGQVLHIAKGEGTRPEIARNDLTKLLLGNIPSDSIKWEYQLLSATAIGNDQTELDFGTHGKHTFDLVIGADGAWSRVRRLLTDMQPHFTGMYNVTITIRNITKKYPHLAKLVGSGSFSSLGNKHAVISQRGPIDSSRIYLWLTYPEKNFAVTSGLAGKSAANAKSKLLEDDELLGTFGPKIKELVGTACDEESADNPNGSLDIRDLYKLPHGCSWNHRNGVTIIGDAAHLMLPNGEGVNMAILDSLLLSKAIIQAYNKAGSDSISFGGTFDPLLKEFEIALVERAKREGEDTDTLIGKMFGSDDAGYDVASFFKSMMGQQP